MKIHFIHISNVNECDWNKIFYNSPKELLFEAPWGYFVMPFRSVQFAARS